MQYLEFWGAGRLDRLFATIEFAGKSNSDFAYSSDGQQGNRRENHGGHACASLPYCHLYSQLKKQKIVLSFFDDASLLYKKVRNLFRDFESAVFRPMESETPFVGKLRQSCRFSPRMPA